MQLNKLEIVQKETRHEDKTNSMDRANHNLLTACGNYRCIALEFDQIPKPTLDALPATLGKRIFPL